MSYDKFSISTYFCWKDYSDEVIRQVCENAAAAGAKFLVCDSRTLQILLTTQPEILKKVAKIGTEYGLKFRDAHATWGSCIDEFMGNGNDLNELCSEARLLKHETALHRLGECGIKTYTMHPGAWCSYDRTWFGHEEHYRSVAAKALERLLKTAEEERITIAVENIFEPSTNAFEVRNLVQKFDSPWLGLCLDCGHANLMEPHVGRKNSEMVCYIQSAWEPVGAINFITGIPEMMKPYIVTVHVHDNNALNDEHRNVDGTGTIDWDRFTHVLAKAPRLISVQSEVSYKSPSDLTKITRELQKITDQLEEKA